MLIELINKLKGQRLELAHGTPEEMRNITINELQEWGKDVLPDEWGSYFETFLRLLPCFTIESDILNFRDDYDIFHERTHAILGKKVFNPVGFVEKMKCNHLEVFAMESWSI
jgi:hypothetical protein